MPAGSMAQVSGASIIIMSSILSILSIFISSIMSMDWALTVPANAISSRQQSANTVNCETRFMVFSSVTVHHCVYKPCETK